MEQPRIDPDIIQACEVLDLQQVERDLNAEKVKKGEERASALMSNVLKGKKIQGKRLWFGEQLFREVHKEAEFFRPGWAGKYREADDSVFIGDRRPGVENLSFKMGRLGLWLEEEIERHIQVSNPRLEDGLRIAAAIQFEVSHQLQPFNEGNKRVARTITNGVLVLGSDEFRARKSMIVSPLPILSHTVTEPIGELSKGCDAEELKRLLIDGRELKPDSYWRTLEQVAQQRQLNPLMLHLANMWRVTLGRRLYLIHSTYGRNGASQDDQRLINAFERRLHTLEAFCESQEVGKNTAVQIPDIYVPRYIKAA